MTETTHPKLSVVIPVYHGEPFIEELVSRLAQVMAEMDADFEVILVDDHSPDQSWHLIHKLAAEDLRVKGIRLSRNFGQHYAITAGLSHVGGEWVVVMDCDLQDQPEEIAKLYAKAQEGYDVVLAKRSERQDSFFKRLSSEIFYRVFGYLTDTRQDSSTANFGVFSRHVIRAVLSMGDGIRYFPAMVQWVGFNRTTVPVVHAPRKNGRSSYTLRRLLRLASANMIAFSDKPLRLTVILGFCISAASATVAAYYVIRYYQGQITEPGYASVILSIWFLGGLTIFILGILGTYLSHVFDHVKARPAYIVKETVNVKHR